MAGAVPFLRSTLLHRGAVLRLAERCNASDRLAKWVGGQRQSQQRTDARTHGVGVVCAHLVLLYNGQRAYQALGAGGMCRKRYPSPYLLFEEESLYS
jgi:hypothetical protein